MKVRIFYLAVITTLCSLFVNLGAQTVIKEKVILTDVKSTTPQINAINTAETGRIKVKITMTNNLYCYYNAYWNETKCEVGIGTARITDASGGRHYITGTNGELYFNEEGTYEYLVFWADKYGGESGKQSMKIEIFLDNNLIQTIEARDASRTFGYFQVAFSNCGPECTAPPIPLNYKIKVNPTGFGNWDACKIAQKNAEKDEIHIAVFSPIPYHKNFINSFTSPNFISKCFDKTAQNWRFNINRIEINTILSICLDNIPSWRKGKEIYNDTPFCTYSKHELELILQDLEAKLVYRSVNVNGYLFIDLDFEHEKVHLFDYEKIIKKHFSQVKKEFENYKPKCGDENIDEKAANLIGSKLNLLQLNAEKDWLELKKSDKYEYKTQANLYDKIEQLIEIIKNCEVMRKK